MPNLAPGPTPYVDLTASSPPRPVNTVLHDAINTAHESRIRLALRNACDISGEVARVVQEMLLVPEARVTYQEVEQDINSDGVVPFEEEDENANEESDEDSESKDIHEEEDEDDNEDKDADARRTAISQPGMKRMRPRFATCENCDEEFDVETNDKSSCIWHPGVKEPDYESDFWADHDERCHGVIADLGDEYPEGFVYDCCNRQGDNEGCKIGTHVEGESVYKKVRY